MSASRGDARMDRQGGVSWGHVAFVLVVAGLSAFYLLDVLSVSTNLNNVILVVPVVALVVVLCLAIAVKEIAGRSRRDVRGDEEARTAGEEGPAVRKALAIMGAMGLYVVAYPLVGIDVATLAFMVFALFVQGVRRPSVLIVYPVVFSLVVVWGAKKLLPYPLPVALL